MPRIGLKACGGATKGHARSYDRVVILDDKVMGTPPFEPHESNELRRDECGEWDVYPIDRVCAALGVHTEDIHTSLTLDDIIDEVDVTDGGHEVNLGP